MSSCFYTGTVRHRRFTPNTNSFTYKLMMFYLDLDEVDTLFSTSFWKPLSFRRQDYFDQSEGDLKKAVIDYVREGLPQAEVKKIRLLTQVRCFNYVINPISCYYCFDAAGALQAIVLEVTNTPWDEKQLYLLECHPSKKTQRVDFQKAMHVSPFNPMDMEYKWSNNTPGEQLSVHLSCWHDNEKHVDATLALSTNDKQLFDADTSSLRFVYMTYKIVSLIYWQAAKLLLVKRIPFYGHPNS